MCCRHSLKSSGWIPWNCIAAGRGRTSRTGMNETFRWFWSGCSPQTGICKTGFVSESSYTRFHLSLHSLTERAALPLIGSKMWKSRQSCCLRSCRCFWLYPSSRTPARWCTELCFPWRMRVSGTCMYSSHWRAEIKTRKQTPILASSGKTCFKWLLRCHTTRHQNPNRSSHNFLARSSRMSNSVSCSYTEISPEIIRWTPRHRSWTYWISFYSWSNWIFSPGICCLPYC